jgi:TonB family protein
MPAGRGTGNGSAGSHGMQGTVASVGFGDGIASSGTGHRSPKNVSTGGFGDAASAVAASRRATRAPDITPAEILVKPRPAYTEEACKLGTQGEVLLAVMFGASRNIHIERVIRGLGHGLDEAAQRAAEQIRFQPAKRNGQPYDSSAIVHIVFELAQ